MKVLKIEIISDDKVKDSKQMAYSNEKEFFTALVTLCDELGVDVPLWTTTEEKIIEKKGHLEMEMDDGLILRIYCIKE